MLSSIWTQCAGASELRRLRGRLWRIVESQHQVSTAKLVAADDQGLLEDILEASKPPQPKDAADRHDLIATPFRYPPLKHGSRFGDRFEPSLLYGSRDQVTALCEAAWYRLVFLAGTEADLAPITSRHHLFQLAYDSARGIDLTQPPFAAHRAELASATDYKASQQFGKAMREAGVTLFRFFSARDREGVNIAAFTARAITSKRPERLAGWSLVTDREGVLAVADLPDRHARHHFERGDFLLGGMLPSPAV